MVTAWLVPDDVSPIVAETQHFKWVFEWKPSDPWSDDEEGPSHLLVSCSPKQGVHFLWTCKTMGRVLGLDHAGELVPVAWAFRFTSGTQTQRVSISRPMWTVLSALDVIEIQYCTLSDFIPTGEDAAVLTMDDGEVPASKQVLSIHSPYFKSLFFGNFTEATTGRYTLKDVNIEEFQLFLSVLYNMDIPIATRESLQTLLRLADMWLVDVVTNRCG
uniref:BTB domain-containing protein n=1 Tax=Steinernema glaseri TaxID=37863 RepID=A0A1I7YU09_9BILA